MLFANNEDLKAAFRVRSWTARIRSQKQDSERHRLCPFRQQPAEPVYNPLLHRNTEVPAPQYFFLHDLWVIFFLLSPKRTKYRQVFIGWILAKQCNTGSDLRGLNQTGVPQLEAPPNKTFMRGGGNSGSSSESANYLAHP